MTAAELCEAIEAEAGRVAWQGSASVTLTIGAEAPRELAASAHAMARAIADAGSGYTLTDAEGGWRGGSEASATFTIVGGELAELVPIAAAAARAAWHTGREAIQAEWRDGGSYSVIEWRAASLAEEYSDEAEARGGDEVTTQGSEYTATEWRRDAQRWRELCAKRPKRKRRSDYSG